MKDKPCEKCWSRWHTTHAHHILCMETCNCPTPPTQEKVFTDNGKGGAIEFKSTFSPTTNIEPTQATESLQDFDEVWRMLFVDYGTAPISSIKDYGYIRLKAFIKQKKQEWQEEVVDYLEKVGIQKEDDFVIPCQDIQTLRMNLHTSNKSVKTEVSNETLSERLSEARTQGAEAAVKYIKENSGKWKDQTGQVYEVGTDVLEEARKI